MKSPKYLLLHLCLLLCIILSFWSTLPHYKYSVFNDIKTRVVGSRLAYNQLSPYFHKYNANVDSIALLDPYEKQQQIVNGNTVPPTLLMLLQPLHQLPFYRVVGLWFWLSYAAFFTILYWLYNFSIKHNYSNYYIAFIGSLLLLVVGWRFHVLSGQMYIFYSLLAVSSLYFFGKKNLILSAILAGVFTAIRFPAAILFLPFMFNNKKFAYTFFATIIVLITTSIAFYNIQVWQQYFASMQIHGLENANAIPELLHPTFAVPNYIEGVRTFASKELVAYIQFINADIFSVQKLLVSYNLPSNTWVLISLFLGSSIVLFGGINYCNNGFYRSFKHQVLYSSLLFFIVDYYLPALRFNYNFLQFLVPLAVVVFYQFKCNFVSKLLLTTGVLLNIVKLNLLPECYSIGEVLCNIAVIIILTTNKVKQT